MAVLLDPVDEILPQLVILGVPDDVLVERGTVVLDELAADDAKPLGGVAAEVLETLVKQGGHLGGVRLGRAGREVVALLVTDTGLGGVGDGDLQLGREEILLVLRIIDIGIERIHDALDEPHVLLGLLVLDTLQVDVVEVVLLVEDVDHAEHLVLGVEDGLADGHARIHDALLVGDVDLPVDERTQEIALAELEDSDGPLRLGDGRLIELLDHCN